MQLLSIMRDADKMPDPWRAHWNVFDVSPSEGPMHKAIQRCDEPDVNVKLADDETAECVFEDDDDAMLYVMYRATRYACPQAREALRAIVQSWGEADDMDSYEVIAESYAVPSHAGSPDRGALLIKAALDCTCGPLPEPPNDDCSVHGEDGDPVYRCVSGHDRCGQMSPGPECPYCEAVTDDDALKELGHLHWR